ncbi:hypothetical protein VaNZ11_017084 [Volvox africanus]|uniref:CCHC-type domain-containing protein n=1 Tax=Volvox africanus TaxID=51714 RepID=A0ABQ5SP16_9CHLO|nr:hypothetical protein VaNZ11_017084 [Volvox africanus]
MQASNLANAVSALAANTFQFVGRIAANASQANRWEWLSRLTQPPNAAVAGGIDLPNQPSPIPRQGGTASPEAPTSPIYAPSPFYVHGPAVVSNHLTPGAVDIPGMAPAAAATNCAAVAGTSSRPPGPPHTGHEDEDMACDDPDEETPAPPTKKPRAASVRPGITGHEDQPQQVKGAGKSKRGGGQQGRHLAPKGGHVQKKGPKQNLAEYLTTFKCTRREFHFRKQHGMCLRCGSDQHRVDSCPMLGAEKNKGKDH